jgi:nitroreductase
VDLFDAISKRGSIRIFQQRSVDKKILKRIYEAINAAPSAANLQAYQVTVVDDQERKNALMAAAYDQVCISRAPVVLVFCTVPDQSGQRFGERGAELFCIQDAAIAASYAQLAATALGLGSVWIGSFDPDEARAAIDAQPYVTPVAMLPLGYPDEEPTESPRMPLEQLVIEG